METVEEKILVYLGPSLSLKRAREILPGAIYRPPARQGDLVTDLIRYQPQRIILIDGVFRENLSVWHKEIVYAVQFPSLKAIYGASSMGALRAAECDHIGMIGIGQIYQWYRDSVTEDDSEVALNYTSRETPEGTVYSPLTVPLVDIRAGVEHFKHEYPDKADRADSFFEAMQKVHYADRTQKACEQCWSGGTDGPFPRSPQKEIDAVHALNDFRSYRSCGLTVPEPKHLSMFFQALFERDRRVEIADQQIAQQHLEAYQTLHNPEWERVCWDSSNQELALLLCDFLAVTLTIDEINREAQRYQQKCGIETTADFERLLANNGWSRFEFDRLMIQNARIRKLQNALTVTKMQRRNTQSVIDYLRTHQGFDFWAALCARTERKLADKAVDEWIGFNSETPVWKILSEHFEQEGLELKCTYEEYLLATGFSNQIELGVALERLNAAKEQEEN
jgi:hypothetical protein